VVCQELLISLKMKSNFLYIFHRKGHICGKVDCNRYRRAHTVTSLVYLIFQ